MESLVEALASLGYEQCDDSNVEAGYQKVALYGFEGRFEHAAVQMPDGRWRRKMRRGGNRTFLSRVALWRSVRRRNDIHAQGRRFT